MSARTSSVEQFKLVEFFTTDSSLLVSLSPPLWLVEMIHKGKQWVILRWEETWQVPGGEGRGCGGWEDEAVWDEDGREKGGEGSWLLRWGWGGGEEDAPQELVQVVQPEMSSPHPSSAPPGLSCIWLFCSGTNKLPETKYLNLFLYSRHGAF